MAMVAAVVTIFKYIKTIFFYTIIKFEHFKHPTLNLEVPQ